MAFQQQDLGPEVPTPKAEQKDTAKMAGARKPDAEWRKDAPKAGPASALHLPFPSNSNSRMA